MMTGAYWHASLLSITEQAEPNDVKESASA